MADEIVVKKTTPPPPPEGGFVAVCVDVIDMGEKVDTYMGKTEITRRCEIVFQIDEFDPKTSERFIVSTEKTISFGPKAKLRKFLEDWRGKPYTPEQAEQGIALHKLVGHPAYVTLAHKVSGAGNTYALIQNIVPLPRQMMPFDVESYERPKYYEQRKEDWAKAVAEHRAQEQRKHNPRPTEDVLAEVPADDSELPF